MGVLKDVPLEALFRHLRDLRVHPPTVDELRELEGKVKAEYEDAVAGGGTRKKRRHRPKRDNIKAKQRRAEREKQRAIDTEIFGEWRKRSWDDYQDYANWKNGYLPEGWPELNRRSVELAVRRAKACMKRAGKWPPPGSRKKASRRNHHA